MSLVSKEKKQSKSLASINDEGARLGDGKSTTKKKFGLISSLYNTYSNNGNSSNNEKKTSKSENELLENYHKGIPVSPADVLKLNHYTQSK